VGRGDYIVSHETVVLLEHARGRVSFSSPIAAIGVGSRKKAMTYHLLSTSDESDRIFLPLIFLSISLFASFM
jgi:hypothetical protein